MSKVIKIVVGVSILVVLGIGVTVLVVMTNISSSLDNPTALLLDAIEQKDYKAAEAAIHQGADVNYTIVGRSLLHQSVTDNKVDDVYFLVKHGANVNTKTKFGRSPLHEAALYGHYDIAKLLIKAGADVNARNSRGETPLYYAEKGLIAGPPHTPLNDKVAQLLRLHGAKRYVNDQLNQGSKSDQYSQDTRRAFVASCVSGCIKKEWSADVCNAHCDCHFNELTKTTTYKEWKSIAKGSASEAVMNKVRVSSELCISKHFPR
jgi:hypothetical protein